MTHASRETSGFRLRAVFGLILLLACAPPLAAQPDPTQGTLQGLVKLSDGTPCAGLHVSVQVGNSSQGLQTKEDGTFIGMYPAGDVQVTLPGKQVTAAIKPGMTTPIEIVVELKGVLLTMTPQDGTLMYPEIRGAFKGKDGTTQVTGGLRVGPATVLFTEVPAIASDFSAVVRATLPGIIGFGQYTRRQWTFDEQAPVRKVTMAVAAPPRLHLRVEDRAGNSLAGTNVNATIVLQYPDDLLWGPWEGGTRKYNWAVGQVVGEDGILDLGCNPIGTLIVTMRTDGGVGSPQQITLAADGTPTPDKYVIQNTVRTVTQTVFGVNGKPAAGKHVQACYAWDGKMVLKAADTDAEGQVSWPDLPPVRVIVWGDDVPAGVIPPDADAVTVPLPAPTPGEQINLRFQFTGVEGRTDRFNITLVPEAGQSNRSTVTLTEGGMLHTNLPFRGTRFTLLGISDTAPPRAVVLRDIYAPYGEDDGNTGGGVVFEITPREGVAAVLQLPKPGVSRLRALPLDPADRDVLAGGVVTATEQPDGTYLLLTPLPGAYGLQVDLMGDETPAAELPRVTVKTGMSTVEAVLPPPLFTAPPGTEVSWVTLNAPLQTRVLTLSPLAESMPVYGSRETLLACWTRPRPDRLMCWTHGEDAPRTLALTRTYLSMKTPEGALYSSGAQVMPLFPVMRDRRSSMNADQARVETAGILLDGKPDQPLNLWPGQYLLSQDWRTVLRTPPLAQQPGKEATLTIEGDALRYGPPSRNLRIRFPAISDEQRKQACQRIIHEFDAPWPNEQSIYARKTDIWLQAPLAARRLSLYWLGVGTARDLEIPPAPPNGGETIITVDAWEPGETVSGAARLGNGNPRVNGNLYAASAMLLDYGDAELRITTDANGKFTIPNVPPGLLRIYADGPEDGSWMVNVPEKGLTELMLCSKAQQIRINGVINYGPRGRVYWRPESGKPMRVANRYSDINCFDLQAGAGEMWVVDGSAGYANYARMTIAPQRNNSIQFPNTFGPSLGLIYPLPDNPRLPGSVILVGRGPWEGVQVEFSNFSWFPSTGLNLIVGQVDAVPPGEWLVRVETPDGLVEKMVTVTELGGTVRF